MIDVAPYKKRYFRFDDCWEIDGLTFKTYLITRSGEETISEAMLGNAKAYVRLTLPSIRQQEGADHGLGYIILHAGEMGNWLLIHWWAYQDIALRMLASADIGNTHFKSEDHRRFHACVWEHVVIDHERDAWVEHMMKEQSDPEGYLAATLQDAEY
ncbi:MAG: hypothetical protein AAFZ74_16625 [Pseudomonadota bacterium]